MFWRRKKSQPPNPPEEENYMPAPVPVAVQTFKPNGQSHLEAIATHLEKRGNAVAAAKELEKLEISASLKFFALYEYDGAYKAIGPFNNRREAMVWCAGLKHAEDEDYHILGVVSDLVGFDELETIEPDIK
jgi:hypothetical protein